MPDKDKKGNNKCGYYYIVQMHVAHVAAFMVFVAHKGTLKMDNPRASLAHRHAIVRLFSFIFFNSTLDM